MVDITGAPSTPRTQHEEKMRNGAVQADPRTPNEEVKLGRQGARNNQGLVAFKALAWWVLKELKGSH